MRLIGYIRVSQVRGRNGDSFISPAVQRERIAAQAAAGGHTIVEWIEDLDEPGSRYARPGFQRALEMVEMREADGVVVAKLDRFSRSVADAARALDRLEAAGGVLLAADLGMDTSTPSGKLMRNVLVALAEFELERIRDSWKDATAKAIDRGVYIAGKVPVGYSRGDDGRLARDPLAAEAVRSIFLDRGAGASWRTICERLDADLPQEGAWTPQRLQWIVRNRAYLGEARQGSVTNPDAHEPLVSRVEFESAQPNGERREWRGEPRLLSGLVRCATCGYAMRRDYTRRDYPRYSCGTRKARGVCTHPVTIGADRLETYVWEAFLARAAADDAVELDGTPVEDLLAQAVAALEQGEAELKAYRATNLVTVLGEEAFTAGITERAEAVTKASAQVAELRRRTTAPTSAAVLEDSDSLTAPERRVALEATLRAVLVSPAPSRGSRPVVERVSLAWVGDSLPDLPGLANRPH